MFSNNRYIISVYQCIDLSVSEKLEGSEGEMKVFTN